MPSEHLEDTPNPPVIAQESVLPLSVAAFYPYARETELGADATLIGLWAHLNERAGLLGLYHCPTRDLGDGIIPVNRATAALSELESRGVVFHCPDTMFLWAGLQPDWALGLSGKSLKPNDNRRKAVVKQWVRCPSQKIKAVILERYGQRLGIGGEA